MADGEKYSDASRCAEPYQQDYETGECNACESKKQILCALFCARDAGQGICNSPMYIQYPTPYADVRLEEDYKGGRGLDCDLTFWAVQFKNLVEAAGSPQTNYD